MAVKIVITGAPGSGKTACVERLKKHPDFIGFTIFNELARELLEENPDYRNNRRAFHIEIYNRQTSREDQLNNQPFITDRGTLDAFAFHPETAEAVGTTIEKEYLRYDAVIQLMSSAGLGEEYYKQDSIRTESIENALIIENAITSVWSNHPHYHCIAAHPSFEEKFAELLITLQSIIE